MSAIVPLSGKIRQLDRPAEPDEQITPEQMADVPRTARLLMRILRDLATLKRRWWPETIEFQDVGVRAGGAAVRLGHGLGSVRYTVVRWSSSASMSHALQWDTSASDDRTLVLRSFVSGIATIRVEQGG